MAFWSVSLWRCIRYRELKWSCWCTIAIFLKALNLSTTWWKFKTRIRFYVKESVQMLPKSKSTKSWQRCSCQQTAQHICTPCAQPWWNEASISQVGQANFLIGPLTPFCASDQWLDMLQFWLPKPNSTLRWKCAGHSEESPEHRSKPQRRDAGSQGKIAEGWVFICHRTAKAGGHPPHHTHTHCTATITSSPVTVSITTGLTVWASSWYTARRQFFWLKTCQLLYSTPILLQHMSFASEMLV